MKGDRLETLARKRERLLVDCAVQRVELGYYVDQLGGVISAADRVVVAVQTVRRHPVLLVAAAAFLLAVTRGRLLGLASRGWAAWRVFKTFFARPAAGIALGALVRAARRRFF